MKTSNKLLLGFLLCIVLAMVAVAINLKKASGPNKENGQRTSESRPVFQFDKLELKGNMRVYLSQGDGPELQIMGGDHLIEEVETEVKDGTLLISFDPRMGSDDSMLVYLSVNALSSLKCEEGVIVKTTTPLSSPSLKLEAATGSIGRLQLDVASFTLNAASGAILKISGKAPQADVSFSSGAMLDAKDLNINTCQAKGAWGGMAKLNVLEKIDVTLSSGAILEQSGDAKVGQSNISTGGILKKKTRS
jgi:hypothetical protein